MTRRDWAIRRAVSSDAEGIRDVLKANRGDSSLFQQPKRRIRRQINDFVVVVGPDGAIIACAATHWHRADNVEILAFAVSPPHQGRGIGGQVMAFCVEQTGIGGVVWLSTKKPGYFGRFGFRAVSRWTMPLGVLLTKVRLIFEQPLSRWIPSLYGTQFMRLTGGAAPDAR